MFTTLDKNGNGMVTQEEMITGLMEINRQAKLKLTEEDASQLFMAMDINQSGQVDYSEFIAAFMENVINTNENYLKHTFSKFDENGDGKINKVELAKVMYGDGSTNFNKEEIDEIIQKADVDGDGKVSSPNFLIFRSTISSSLKS